MQESGENENENEMSPFLEQMKRYSSPLSWEMPDVEEDVTVRRQRIEGRK